MDNIVNKEKDKWIRPWNMKNFDSLSIRDDRFFSILIKGILNFMNREIVMYDKPIKHFILHTGSTYLYVEKNGYEFSLTETTGEDIVYHELPRCICELSDINIPTEELTNPFVRGTYERLSSKDGQYHGYNAQIRRLPIELNMNLHYVFGTFNENIVVLQEIFDKLVFQRYFKIVYLGQNIQCSIEFPSTTTTNIPKIDFDSTETNQKTMDIQIKVESYYPIINEQTECENNKIIGKSEYNINIEQNEQITDIHKYTIE